MMNAQSKLLAAAAVLATAALAFWAVRAGLLQPGGAHLDSSREPAVAPLENQGRSSDRDEEQAAARVAAGMPATAADSEKWALRYFQSTDHFQLASQAARAALAGDGRAAYYVAPILTECTGVERSSAGGPDRKAAYDQYLSTHFPHRPDWVREEDEQKFRRCARFLTEKPFADLPAREGGYPIAFWRDLAVTHGDPVARVERAVGEIAQLSDSTTASRRAEIVSNAQDTIRDAITSRDPEAMFRVGMMLADSSVGADPEHGLAWTVLACETGYDCSARNPANVFSRCARSGACPPDADWQYYMQQGLGPEGYARAYAKAQELKDLLARDDRQALASHMRLAPR